MNPSILSSAEPPGARPAASIPRVGSFVGECEAVRDLQRTLDRVSARDVTVLLEGETGTGKELLSRQIHAGSPRACGPFVPVDASALQNTLLESQLFGHVKGAFTGATHSTLGFFRSAHQGTLFLDEIGELPFGMQAKLLRCIQERAVTPLGDSNPIPVNVRFIAATNRDLKAMVERGEFRHDLYYRLAVVRLTLPPLRERQQDIAILARHFLRTVAEFYDEDQRTLSSDAVAVLQAHAWPGNVRELSNVMERVHILSNDIIIDAERMRRVMDGCVHDTNDNQTLAAAERGAILRALANAGNTRSRAASILGIDRRRLNRLMRRLRIELPNS